MKQLKEQLKAAKDRAYSLKTKKAQRKAWDRVRDIEREILFGSGGLFEQANVYATHSVKGVVKRFYAGCSDVLIETKEYGNLWVNIANDVEAKSWYDHTCCIEYTEGQTVIVECTIEVDSDRLCLYVQAGHVTGGRVNETQYAELCKRDDLAFFKYPNLNGVTGLFSQSKAVSRE
jgi:hypothetical protein